MLRSDSAHHCVLWISEWPRSLVFPGFLAPVLLSSGIRRTFTLLYTPLKYGRNVQNPVLEALGFDRKRALERAAQEAKLLPTGLGADYVGLSRTGEFVLSPQPDPTPAAE